MLERVIRAGRVAAYPILLYTLDRPKLINWQALWCVFVPEGQLPPKDLGQTRDQPLA